MTAGEVLTVAAVRRPRGALGWDCDRTGIAVQSPALGAGRHGIVWSGDTLRVALRRVLVRVGPGGRSAGSPHVADG